MAPKPPSPSSKRSGSSKGVNENPRKRKRTTSSISPNTSRNKSVSPFRSPSSYSKNSIESETGPDPLQQMLTTSGLDKEHEIYASNWTKSFQVHALVVQLVMETQEVKEFSGPLQQPMYQINQTRLPKEIAFTTLPYKYNVYDAKEEKYEFMEFDTFDFIETESESQFIKLIKAEGVELNTKLTIENDEWKTLMNFLHENKYMKFSEKGWTPTTAERPIQHSLQNLYFLINDALISGMSIGTGKRAIDYILNYIKERLGIPSPTMTVIQPSVADFTNGRIQMVSHRKYFKDFRLKFSKSMVHGDSDSSLPPSWCEASHMSSNRDCLHHYSKREVPDIVMWNRYIQGKFYLVVELKKDQDDFPKAILQAQKQALTALHFQNFVFSFVLSSSNFSVILMKKRRKMIKCYIVTDKISALCEDQVVYDDVHPHVLDVQKLTKLCNWFYWVVDLYKSDIA